jgi:hypothetical protein
MDDSNTASFNSERNGQGRTGPDNCRTTASGGLLGASRLSLQHERKVKSLKRGETQRAAEDYA